MKIEKFFRFFIDGDFEYSSQVVGEKGVYKSSSDRGFYPDGRLLREILRVDINHQGKSYSFLCLDSCEAMPYDYIIGDMQGEHGPELFGDDMNRGLDLFGSRFTSIVDSELRDFFEGDNYKRELFGIDGERGFTEFLSKKIAKNVITADPEIALFIREMLNSVHRDLTWIQPDFFYNLDRANRYNEMALKLKDKMDETQNLINQIKVLLDETDDFMKELL